MKKREKEDRGGDKLLPEYKRLALIGVRSVETLCIAMSITGFIWATADLLLVRILIKMPVNPFSILLMLYGTVGSFGTEVVARWLSRGVDETGKK